MKEKARFLRSQYEQPEAWSYNPARVESIRAEAPAKLKEAAALEDRAAELEKELRALEKESAEVEARMLRL